MVAADLMEQASAIVDLMPRLMRRLFELDADDPTNLLPVAQLRVCGILHDCPRTISELSRELGVSPSAATQLVDRLEKTGLVERIAETEDRRVKHVRLTAHGEQVLGARRKRREARVLDTLSSMTPEARESVVRALRTLLDHIG